MTFLALEQVFLFSQVPCKVKVQNSSEETEEWKGQLKWSLINKFEIDVLIWILNDTFCHTEFYFWVGKLFFWFSSNEYWIY